LDLVFIEQSPMQGKERPIQPGAVIGREGTDVVLSDPEVSRRHAAIRQLDGGLAIEDLGSTNGTFVNGQRISGIVGIGEGDEVKCGNTVMKVASPGGATRASNAIPAGEGTAAPPASAAPQVTTAAQRPAAPEPAAAPVAAAEPAAAQAPAPQANGSARGDVPQPSLNAPSAIRRVLPAPGAAGPTFNPPPPQKGRSSAATSSAATAVAFLIVLATLAGVVLYFAL
jgi:predicted component of type VI protein secretion system